MLRENQADTQTPFYPNYHFLIWLLLYYIAKDNHFQVVFLKNFFPLQLQILSALYKMAPRAYQGTAGSHYHLLQAGRNEKWRSLCYRYRLRQKARWIECVLILQEGTVIPILECFVTLAKNLNYAKTAERLSISQPTVSRQIQSDVSFHKVYFNPLTISCLEYDIVRLILWIQ